MRILSSRPECRFPETVSVDEAEPSLAPSQVIGHQGSDTLPFSVELKKPVAGVRVHLSCSDKEDSKEFTRDVVRSVCAHYRGDSPATFGPQILHGNHHKHHHHHHHKHHKKHEKERHTERKDEPMTERKRSHDEDHYSSHEKSSKRAKYDDPDPFLSQNQDPWAYEADRLFKSSPGH